MKKPKKALGVFTFLCGFSALLAIVALLSIPETRETASGLLGGFSLNLVTLSLLLNVIIRGIGGVIGGVMLYKGMEKGYYICSVVWGYFLLTSLYGLAIMFASGAIDTWGLFANIAIIKLLLVVIFSSFFLVSLYKGFKDEPDADSSSKGSGGASAAGV